MSEAYEGTKVNYMRTQAKIGELLSKNGILDKQFTHLGSEKRLILLFKKEIMWEGKKLPLGVKIDLLKVPAPVDTSSLNECNRKHRVLFYWLKSKFEAINEDLYEDVVQGFVKEFYPNLLFGNKTILERTFPEFTRAFIEGRTEPKFLLE